MADGKGKVRNAGRRKVGRGDGEGLRRSVELDDTCWGDADRREVGLGDGEVRGRSVKLGGVGRSLEVNDEARRAESMSIIEDGGGGGGGGGDGKTFSSNLTGKDTKIFF